MWMVLLLWEVNTSLIALFGGALLVSLEITSSLYPLLPLPIIAESSLSSADSQNKLVWETVGK